MTDTTVPALADALAFPNHISAKRLRDLITYDPETGLLHWNEDAADKDGQRHRCAGKPAFQTRNDNGYLRGKLDRRRYYAGPIIWLWMTGEWPEGQVDHINHIRDDNRWENLRDISASENMKNKARSYSNTSGTTGVSWDKTKLRWIAKITVNGKRIHLGSFSDKLEAISARKKTEQEHGWPKNSGHNEYKEKACHQPCGPKQQKETHLRRIKKARSTIKLHEEKHSKRLKPHHSLKRPLYDLLAEGLCGKAVVV